MNKFCWKKTNFIVFIKGFYGFPDCKPCDCPSKSLCEKDTGACICPPHVTGEKCDKCELNSFGFDQFFGCELCNCNSVGVQNNELQCDLNNGSCKLVALNYFSYVL